MAMVLLGLIVSGVLATFSIVGKAPSGPLNLDAPSQTGLNFARDTLDELKNAVSDDPVRGAPLVDSDPALDKGTTYQNDPAPDSVFKRKYVVEDVDLDDDKIADYKRVTVTVTW
ncbi:MAG: hypothetical protein HY589_02495 [Candidatus Omnitrophica bacterium]|nr:hypothetical protein [Candidatus Omnitrophota bacterium]